MVYFGKVQNGKIVPEPGARLTEGETVRIEPVNGGPPPPSAPTVPTDPAYRLHELAVDDDLPPDLAREHDHYIHGTRKRGS